MPVTDFKKAMSSMGVQIDRCPYLLAQINSSAGVLLEET